MPTTPPTDPFVTAFSTEAGPMPPAPPVQAIDALAIGARMGEFEIQRVLGVGGFGIVYLAFDHALEREVALKEYMPASLAARSGGSQISLRSTSHADTFAIGLRSFVNEARLLAQFDHPSLVKVYRFWEANNTAYMVMPYYRGVTLHAARRAMARPPDEAWLRALVDPLLGALEVLHDQAVYHRDIAPDNILMLDGGPQPGRPVLLDFGAARRVIGDRTQNLTAILKPAFAPVEQYADVVHLKQGPWTDLYALGAVLYYALGGQPPAPSASRAVHDELPSARRVAAVLAQVHPGLTYSDSLLAAIDWALAVRPADRPQSVQAFRDALRTVGGREAVHTPRPAPQASLQPPPGVAATTEFAPTAAQDGGRAGLPGLPAGDRPRPAMHWAVAGLAGMLVLAVTAGLGWWASERLAQTVEGGEPAAVSVAPGDEAVARTAAASDPELPVAAPPVAPQQAPAPTPGGSAALMPATPPAVARTPADPQTAPALTGRAAAQASQGTVAPAPDAVPSMRSAVPVADDVTPVSAPPARRLAERRAEPAAVPARQERAEAPASPREACGRRMLLALWRCMQEQCESSRYARHAQCVAWREQEARNRAPADF